MRLVVSSHRAADCNTRRQLPPGESTSKALYQRVMQHRPKRLKEYCLNKCVQSNMSRMPIVMRTVALFLEDVALERPILRSFMDDCALIYNLPSVMSSLKSPNMNHLLELQDKRGPVSL